VPKVGLPRTPPKSYELSKTRRSQKRPAFDNIILLLQGSGALGLIETFDSRRAVPQIARTSRAVTRRTAHRLNPADQMDVRPDHSEVKASARADIAITDLPVMERDLLSLWTALPLQADKLPDMCSASLSWLSSRYPCKRFLGHCARSTDSSVSFVLERRFKALSATERRLRHQSIRPNFATLSAPP
jgi:hypothetical protein